MSAPIFRGNRSGKQKHRYYSSDGILVPKGPRGVKSRKPLLHISGVRTAATASINRSAVWSVARARTHTHTIAYVSVRRGRRPPILASIN